MPYAVNCLLVYAQRRSTVGAATRITDGRAKCEDSARVWTGFKSESSYHPHCPSTPTLPVTSHTALHYPHCPSPSTLPFTSYTALHHPPRPSPPTLPFTIRTALHHPHCPSPSTLPFTIHTALHHPHRPSPLSPLSHSTTHTAQRTIGRLITSSMMEARGRARNTLSIEPGPSLVISVANT